MHIINWKDKRWRGKKGSQLFEALCHELLDFEGYFNLDWRKGSADGGRDIQGEKIITEELDGSKHLYKYWFQCKMFNSGIGLNNISSSIIQASNQAIDYFVLMSPAHTTPQLTDELDRLNKNHKYRFKIVALCGKHLEEKIIRYEEKFKFPSKYFEVNRNINGKVGLINFNLESPTKKIERKYFLPFSKAEENEFTHFEKIFNIDVFFDVALEEENSRLFLARPMETLQYSVSLLDLLVTWFRKNSDKESVELFQNCLPGSDIVYISVMNMIEEELKKKKYQILRIQVKGIPYLELRGARIITSPYNNSILFAKKMFRFYYWLNFKGTVKSKLEFNLIKRIEHERRKVKPK